MVYNVFGTTSALPAFLLPAARRQVGEHRLLTEVEADSLNIWIIACVVFVASRARICFYMIIFSIPTQD